MQSPEVPPNESERICALQNLEVLDSAAEERFDRITRLAQTILKAPITLVSLVDTERQWFKSKQGLDADETPRSISFCGHAILENQPFYIPNVLNDDRFADNPLVTGPPNIRSYLGIPINTPEGFRIGTLCAIDSKPTNYSEDDISSLQKLAKCIESELVHNLNTRELLEAKLLAEQQDRAKTDFINMMSHELRTPLTVMLGYIPLLGNSKITENREQLDAILNEMTLSGQHLLKLINDLLDISKIEAGELNIYKKPICLVEQVDSAISALSYLAQVKGIELRNECDDLQIIFDPLRFQQVLINLVNNALKFTEKGSVILSSASEGESIIVNISDTGLGIPTEAQKTIFDKFQQVDSSKTRQAGGSGLGLNIVKHIMSLHAGTIDVKSEVGLGSCFSITFPSKVDADR